MWILITIALVANLVYVIKLVQEIDSLHQRIFDLEYPDMQAGSDIHAAYLNAKGGEDVD